MPLAFISHNRADKPTAEEIGLLLVAEEIGVWFDKWEITPGDSIVGKINDALARTTHVVLLWSANAAKSRWVGSEMEAAIAMALDKCTPRIVPIRLDDTPLPPLLQPIRYIRYHGLDNESRREIVGAVTGREPTDEILRAFVRKYHSLIRDESRSGDPLPYRGCPECGSTKLVRETYIARANPVADYPDDVSHPVIRCAECKWRDWGPSA